MLKEYISRLQEENRKKIEEIDLEMNGLSSELDDSEHDLALLQQEKSLDKTIFSPRALGAETDKKIEEKQHEIEQLRRRLDYAGQMRESEIQNSREYQSLAEEIDRDAPDAIQGTEKANTKNAYVDIEELLSFLNSSCKKIEYSLSLVGGNKNRCKSELRSLLQTTRDYIQRLEDDR